jgi:hypothetical protein
MLEPGDDVIVEFCGTELPGEVVAVYRSSGFILTKIHIDPEFDYGSVSDRLDPESFVCAREKDVRKSE